MNIKALRMKYRQKALPARNAQLAEAKRNLVEQMVRTIVLFTRTLNNPLNRPSNFGELFNHINELTTYATRLGSSLEDIKETVSVAEEMVQQIRSTDSIGSEGATWDLQQRLNIVRQMLEVIEAASWDVGTPAAIAQNILNGYNDWNAGSLILADAMEEGGSTNTRMLEALRSGDRSLSERYIRMIAGNE